MAKLKVKVRYDNVGNTVEYKDMVMESNESPSVLLQKHAHIVEVYGEASKNAEVTLKPKKEEGKEAEEPKKEEPEVEEEKKPAKKK
jgi:hypothetical protein